MPLTIIPNREKWEPVGDCCVHVMMHGEAYAEGRCKIALDYVIHATAKDSINSIYPVSRILTSVFFQEPN